MKVLPSSTEARPRYGLVRFPVAWAAPLRRCARGTAKIPDRDGAGSDNEDMSDDELAKAEA